jgi:hypothetical protein
MAGRRTRSLALPAMSAFSASRVKTSARPKPIHLDSCSAPGLSRVRPIGKRTLASRIADSR